MLEALRAADVGALRWLIAWRAAGLDWLMPALSDLGRGAFIWLVIAAIAAIFPAKRMGAWRLVLAVGLTVLAVDGAIKPAIDRARPFDLLADIQVIHARPATGSFPSGHAAYAFAGALAAGRIFPTARIALWLLASAIALSRVYVGVHWPSDVLAGALIGVACGWFVLGGRRPNQGRFF
jgi:undecaprenyl-diphosphatase